MAKDAGCCFASGVPRGETERAVPRTDDLAGDHTLAHVAAKNPVREIGSGRAGGLVERCRLPVARKGKDSNDEFVGNDNRVRAEPIPPKLWQLL
jgi:hypothetical protein